LILDERGFTSFVDWAERAKELLSQYGTLPSPISEDAWQRWGANLGLLPGIQNIPMPYSYNEWKEWVKDLNRTVDAL
jgi:hypothetical protein